MAYYRSKDIEKSRGNAIQEVILEKRSVAKVLNLIRDVSELTFQGVALEGLE